MRALAVVLALTLAGCLGGTVPGGEGGGGGVPPPAGLLAWDTLPEAPVPRTENSALVVDGKLYVLAGLTASGVGSGLAGSVAVTRVDALDLATGEWSRAPDLPVPIHHTAAVALGARIVVLGGYVASSFTPTPQAWQLDTANPAAGWTSFPTLPAPRGAHAAASDGERIWVFGGVGGPVGLALPSAGALTGVAWVFEAGAWKEIAAFPAPRDHLAGAYFDGKVYAVGGRELSFATNTGRLDAYDPATGEWSVPAPMPTARGGLGAGVLDGRLVVVGGEGNEGTFAEVEAFDPADGTWAALPPLPEARHGMGIASTEDALIVALGGPEPGFTFSTSMQRLRLVSDTR